MKSLPDFFKNTNMPTDNGLSERFLQHSKSFDGSVARLPQAYPDSTKKRMVNEHTIKGWAKQNNVQLDKIVSDILSKYPDELSAYVQSHGEIPFSDITKLGAQAVLIRAKDVSQVATQIDTTDEDALREIEGGEDADQDINAPDEFRILSTEAQAAIKIAMDYLSDCHVDAGGDGTMKSVLQDATLKSASNASNSADGDYEDYSGLSDWYPSSTTVTSGLATIPIDTGTINTMTGMPTITAGPAPSSNAAGIINSSDSTFGSIFGTLSGILGSITQAGQAVQNAAGSTVGAIGAIKNAASGVGANSIGKYISNNKTTIILVFVVIIAVVFLAIYVAKKK